MKTYSTACPRNCYSTCSFKVRVEGNLIVGIDAHPANLATPEGVCLKGLAYLERANSEDRLLYPMEKNQENGEFERVSWERAIGLIVSRLKHYKEAFGSHSIFFYYSSGMAGMLNAFSSKFWEAFGGVTTSYGNLCWPAGLEAVTLTLGENKHNAPWDLENAKLILFWGKNAAETNVQQMIAIDKAQERGAMVVTIDPRRTETAAKSDLYIQIKPGTDAVLALAISKLLCVNGKTDEEFINDNVNGYVEFKDSVQECTAQWASSITGIPKDVISYLADLMGDIKPMTIIPGYGMQRYSNGVQTIRCLLALQIITGNIGKSGGNFHYANLQSYVFDDLKEPESYYPSQKMDASFRREISTAMLGHDMQQLKDPELKMAWIERGNPITQNPDTNQVLKAFRNLEFTVVVDQFMTNTASEADLVLPAKNMFEQSDIIGSYWNPYIQLKPKVIEPAGEVKPETEIYYLIARELNLSDEIVSKYCLPPGEVSVNKYLKNKLESFPELEWEQLLQGPLLANSHEEVAFSSLKFNTVSGKIELFSEEARSRWNVSYLPDYVALSETDKQQYPLHILSPNTKNRIHSQFGNLKHIVEVAAPPAVYMNPEDAATRSVREGDMVRVFNSAGEICLQAAIDYGIRKACISIFNGHWHEEGCVNFLSVGAETDMGFGAAFHNNFAEIEKL